ncbi:hypothetical protein [Escherichia phage M01]|nr:hypothetical protein [Escherichia phage M01]
MRGKKQMINNRKAKILLGLDIAFGVKETARYRVSNNRVGFFDKVTESVS